jgi:hypothetical protein
MTRVEVWGMRWCTQKVHVLGLKPYIFPLKYKKRKNIKQSLPYLDDDPAHELIFRHETIKPTDPTY